MEDKLIFVSVPDIICQLSTKYSFYSSRKYSDLIITLQQDPFLSLVMNKIFAGSTGANSLEAQLKARGVSGFCELLSEFYLRKVIGGHFIATTDLELVQDVLSLEKRFEDFTLMGERRVFLLGMYLKLKDIENEKEGGIAQFLELSPFIDEVLLKAKSKFSKIDWVIVALDFLLKTLDYSIVENAIVHSPQQFEELIVNLEEKQKWGFFTALSLYGKAIGDSDFFLYRKV